MALKIDWNTINEENNSDTTDKNKSISYDKDVPDISDIPDITNIKDEDEQQEDSNEFDMGEQIEKSFEENEKPIKKTFDGPNKDILSNSVVLPDIQSMKKNDLPSIQVDAKDDSNLNINNTIEKIHQKAEQKVSSILDDEIAKERQIIDSSVNKIKVLCIGGNEQYYKTVLAKLNVSYNDVDFIKYVPTGGKNAFYIIDVMQPDIILIYHKAQIQNALQFYDSIQNDADDNNVYYRDKYKNKRIVVIASNDIGYEIKLKEKGIDFYVKELNPRTHTVDVNELITVIREAKKDIDNHNKMENDMLEDNTIDNTDDDLPELNVNITDDNNETSNENKEEEEDVLVTEDKSKTENQNISSANVEINKQNNNLMTEAQWRKKQMGVRRQDDESVADEMSGVGKIIGVYSTTGGAGKTMFASNLASILAKYGNQDGTNNYKVALVEYNLTCKSLDIFFNIKTSKDIATLAKEASEYVDKQGVLNITPNQFEPLISSHMYKIPDINLDILPGISVPLEIENIQKNFTTCLFQTLKEMYDIVIIDTAVDIAKTPVLEAFNMIDEIYYILPMDVSSIRNTKILIKFFTGMFNFRKEKVKVVINKVNPDNEEFGVDQIYAAFANDKCIPEGTIPRMDKEVLSSINRGIPISLEDITNPVANAIYSIGLGINPRMSSNEAMPIEEKEEKSGFLSKLFGSNKKKKNKNIIKDKDEKKEKHSFFNSKKKNNADDEEHLNLPVIKGNKKKKNIFNKKEKTIDDSAMENVDNENVEKEEKTGFLSKLFGSKKKKNNTIKVKNKKKKQGLAGLLGKGKKEINQADDFEENQSEIQTQSRLQTIRRVPMKRQ